MSDEVFPFMRPLESDADMHIQWKGTDVCLDFQCLCQPEEEAFSSHFDGFGAYFLRCPRCGAVYQLGTQVIVRRVEPDPEDLFRIKDLMYEVDDNETAGG